MSGIKEIFDVECSHLKLSPALVREIHIYAYSFVNKNSDHIEFFGSNLLGTKTLRYTAQDRYAWSDGIMGIDEYAIRQRVIALPTMDASWVRATDSVNLSILWLCHKFQNSALSDRDKHQGMVDALLVMHFRMFSSLLAHYFRYPADEDTAIATYAALSKKYDIKRHGNWLALFIARCEDVISPQSIHYQTIQRFNDDAAIVYMVTDIQGRLRSIVKNIWREFDIIRTQNSKITTVGGTITLDGKVMVKDVTRSYAPYKRYMNEIVLDKVRFIKPDLVAVIGSAMQTMPEPLLFKTLEYVSEQCVLNKKYTLEYMDEVLLHAIEYYQNDGNAAAKLNDLPATISKLRLLYMSARSTDPALLKIREMGRKIVADASGSKNDIVIAATCTGLSLYIVTRVFAKQYYA